LKPWGRKASQAQASASVAAAPAESANDGAASDASDAEGNDGVCADGFKTTRDKVDEDLFIEAGQVLDKLRSQLPQSNLDGLQNIWVLKPAGKSRGRGIQLSARLENILEIGVGRGAEARWIAQKYMENPLIIQGKKFDIRQWVVVTRWNPLSVWFYKDCYLRFSFADYDPKKLKNKFAHLTNNSISKHADDFDEQRDDTMWHSDDFQEYLASLRFEKDGKVVDDPWIDVVQKQMKQIVMWSLESVADAVMPRNSAYELFGYDFMLCEDLNAWLIEVNSSPDLSYSTATTRGLVKSMLEDMVRVVVDIEKFGLRPDRPKKKWDTCGLNSGRFELLEPGRRRRQEKFSRLRKDAGQLCIHGSALKPRRPRKGECPNGIDAPDDPKFDALALLSTADGTGDQTADDRDGLGVYQDAASEAEESDGSSVVGVPGGE
jgi:tubulin monoglycylase TTLL3/8